MHHPAALGQVAIGRGIAPIAAIHEPGDHVAHQRFVVGMHKGKFAVVPPQNLRAAPPEDRLRLPRPAPDAKVGIPLDHREGRIFHVVDQPELRLAQLFRGAFHLRDVAGDAGHAQDLPGLVAQRIFRREQPSLGSIRALIGLLPTDQRLPCLHHRHIVRVIQCRVGLHAGKIKRRLAQRLVLVDREQHAMRLVLQQKTALAILAKHGIRPRVDQRTEEIAFVGQQRFLGPLESHARGGRGRRRGGFVLRPAQREERAPHIPRLVEQRQRHRAAPAFLPIFPHKRRASAPPPLPRHHRVDGRPQRGRVLRAVEKRGRLPERFRPRPAEHALRAGIPIADRAVRRRDDHRVVDVVKDQRPAEQGVEPFDVGRRMESGSRHGKERAGDRMLAARLASARFRRGAERFMSPPRAEAPTAARIFHWPGGSLATSPASPCVPELRSS